MTLKELGLEVSKNEELGDRSQEFGKAFRLSMSERAKRIDSASPVSVFRIANWAGKWLIWRDGDK
jgi:hypothetical protein